MYLGHRGSVICTGRRWRNCIMGTQQSFQCAINSIVGFYVLKKKSLIKCLIKSKLRSLLDLLFALICIVSCEALNRRLYFHIQSNKDAQSKWTVLVKYLNITAKGLYKRLCELSVFLCQNCFIFMFCCHCGPESRLMRKKFFFQA